MTRQRASRSRQAVAMVLAALGAHVLSRPALSQQPPATGASASSLAKATQNPIGDLKSLPFQLNFYSGGPLEDRALFNLNFQPVIPVRVGDLNIIMRTIIPYLDIPGGSGTQRTRGLGDIQQQVFFSPAKAGAFIWGIGPVFQVPTATNDLVRTGDWAAGPAAVIVKNAGPFVLGGLATQVWTFSGDEIGPNANQLAIQPFINYNLSQGWALGFGPLMTANWSAPSGEEWTVPLGLGISKVTLIGKQPVSLGVQYQNLVEAPTGTGRNLMRFSVSYLYPNPPPPLHPPVAATQ
jgi:hypothetical protein